MLRKEALKEGDVVHGQYVILEKIDRIQHSSKIYKGWDRELKTFVVIKVTSYTHKEKNKHVTKILQKLKGGTGIPNIIWRGEENHQMITVTDCLGPNLKKLFCLMDKNFSIPTIAMIAIRLLSTLEYIHKNEYVCCNIMPKEILISLNKKNQNLYITDFKQAKKIKKGKVVDVVNHAANKMIVNKFSSVNVHLGLPPNKKDDLESLGYIILFFFKHGEIFEKNSKYATREEKLKHYEMQKLQMIPDIFCAGLPAEMIEYMRYVQTLQFGKTADKPDYEFLRKLFRNLFIKTCLNPDSFEYDWIQLAVYKLNRAGSKFSEKSGYDKQSTIHSNLESIPPSFHDPLESSPSLTSITLNRLEPSDTQRKPGSPMSIFGIQSKAHLSCFKDEAFKAQQAIQDNSDEESNFKLEDLDELKNINGTQFSSYASLITHPITDRIIHCKSMTDIKMTHAQTNTYRRSPRTPEKDEFSRLKEKLATPFFKQ